MASVQINDELINIHVAADSSLQTLIPLVHGKLPYSNYKLVSVSLNGSKLDVNYDKISLSRPLSSEDRIQLILDGNPQMDIIKHIDDLCQGIINRISKIDFNSDQAYHGTLSEVIAGVGVLIKSTSFIVRKLNAKELPIKNLQIHLLSVLKAIETAHNSKDVVMLEDLLEFELKDNLTKWKILVTPILKIQAQKTY